MSAGNVHDNLQRLIRELDAMHPAPAAAGGASQLAACGDMASKMPLAHSASRVKFAAICGSGRLLSKRRLATADKPLDPACVELQLGTDDCVFLFAGGFRYPHTECGFLFKAGLADARRADTQATPFDSGGLVNYHRPLAGESPKDCFARHELPVPEYREYHALVLDRLFIDPWDYLDGKAPTSANPIQLDRTNADDRSWAFELRVQREVPIQEHLQAIFFSRRAFDMPAVRKMALWCKTNRVDRIRCGNFRDTVNLVYDDMKTKSIDYVRAKVMA